MSYVDVRMLVRILVSTNDVQEWGYSIVGASVSIGPHLGHVSLLYLVCISFWSFPACAFTRTFIPWELSPGGVHMNIYIYVCNCVHWATLSVYGSTVGVFNH